MRLHSSSSSKEKDFFPPPYLYNKDRIYRLKNLSFFSKECAGVPTREKKKKKKKRINLLE
jgi:hypothetical protein